MSVDLSRFHRSVLDETINKAKSLLNQGRRAEAADAWQRAAEQADLFAASARTDLERQRRSQTADRLRELAKARRGWIRLRNHLLLRKKQMRILNFEKPLGG